MDPTATPNPPNAPAPTAPAAAGVAAAPALPPHRRRRRWRWYVRLAVVIAVILPVIAAVLTQGPIPAAIIRQYIKASLGLDFDADWVSLKLDGRLVVNGMTLHAPGTKPEPGRFLSARRVEIDLDLSRLTALEVTPTAVTIQDPVFRFSQSQADGSLNVSALRVPAGTGAPTRLPRVDIKGGVLELGEHDLGEAGGPEYRTLMSLGVGGFIQPMDSMGSAYHIRLVQMGGDNLAAGAGAEPSSPAGTPPERVTLDGRLDLESGTGDLALSGLELAKWTPDRIPRQYREMWRGMEMRGQIAETRFQFSGSRVAVTLRMQDVGLRPDIAAGRDDIMGTTRPRMDSVAGVLSFTPAGIEADLNGQFEGQPCQVLLRTEGLGQDAPYSAVITTNEGKIDFEPRILRYLPDVIRDDLALIGWPVGTISAGLTVRRGAPTPTGPGRTTISGTLTMDADKIEYGPFPYPFRNVHAILTFDDEQVRMLSATGRAESESLLFAEGVFAMPGGSGAIKSTLTVAVVDVPMDAAVWNALEHSFAAGIHGALFSRPKHEQLLKQGLVITPEQRERLGKRLARLREGVAEDQIDPADRGLGIEETTRRLSLPEFAFGGDIRSVQVYSEGSPGAGPNQPWHTVIDVDFVRAGLLPEVFPYPIIADDLKLRIDDQSATLIGTRFRGLAGGTASVSGRARFLPKSEEDGSVRFTLDLDVHASDIPVDNLVLFAVPDGRLDLGVRRFVGPPAPPAPDSFSAKRLLAALGLEGPVDCRGTLRTDEQGNTNFNIGIDLKGMTAVPAHRAGGVPVMAANINGHLGVTERGITVKPITGNLLPSDMGLAGLAALAGAGEFVLNGSTTLLPGDSGDLTVDADVSAHNLDLTLALEDLLFAVARDAASQVDELRKQHNPSGRVDADAAVTSVTGEQGSLGFRLAVHGARDLSIDVLGGRSHADLIEGDITVTAQARGKEIEDALLDFSHARGRVSMGEESPCLFAADGALRLPMGGKALRVERDLHANATDARIDSGLAQTILKTFAGETMAQSLRDVGLRGQFDAELGMVRRSPASGNEDWKLVARVCPRWIEAVFNGEKINVGKMSGEVTLDDREGRVKRLNADAGRWTTEIDGRWSIGPPPAEGLQRAWTLDAGFTLDTQGLPADLVALLPLSVSGALRESDVRLNGGLWTSDASLKLAGDDAGRVAIDLDAELDFHGLYASAGMDLADCHGGVHVLAHRGAADEQTLLSLALKADTVELEGVRVTDATALLTSGQTAGVTQLEALSAACHGGRITGRATLHRPTPEFPAAYEAQVELAGVRFADMLGELEHRAALAAPQADAEAGASPLFAALGDGDASRGFLDANLSIAGRAGDASERRGRGSLRIAGGDVLKIPLIVPLLQISNLQLPLGERLDYAQAVFFVQGNRVVFDELGVLSRTLAIVGDGEIVLPGYDLDLHFRSANRLRLPLLTDLYESLRNELAIARITGTLDEPRFGLEPFSGTRRFLGRLFGVTPATPDPIRPAKLRYDPGRQATVPTP